MRWNNDKKPPEFPRLDRRMPSIYDVTVAAKFICCLPSLINYLLHTRGTAGAVV